MNYIGFLKETEQVHGFWRCEKVDNIIRSLNEELNVMDETQIVPTSLSGNLNKMVVVLKECIQEQIIRLV